MIFSGKNNLDLAVLTYALNRDMVGKDISLEEKNG